MGGSGGHGWVRDAIAVLTADRAAEVATPLRRFPLPDDWPVTLLLKDESARPTGSLKHGFARGLLLDALSRGLVDGRTPLVDAASGNTAVAEAHFARRLGLPFTAVAPSRTGRAKLDRIEALGGRTHLVDPPLAVYERARELAADTGGHYLDHLANLAGAVDSPLSAPGLAAEIVAAAHPRWVVLGVGTGASSRLVGRHLRRRGLPTRLAVVDPENSAYFPGWATDCPDYSTGMPSRIEGIGRPRLEPAFDASVVDLVIPVPDAASVAAMRHLHAVTGLRAGPSTGACLWGACHLLHRMRQAGERGSVVMVVGDSGEPYADTCYDDGWVSRNGWDLSGPAAALARFARTGEWDGGSRARG
ncbi:PLP-dependent cysteine synthase family protein [Saccharothrix xinjiangensis]|uniref:PLP-dependent cysteine synthase family protein n=1 Tax=Saccharothrix xinjiangensis TaxID=204798 RepID=A0ABV9XRZ2_9PSEU